MENNEIEKENLFYKSVLNKLKNLRNVLLQTRNGLLRVEKNFKSGGYISNNETFDKGKLEESYNMLDADIESLDSIIANVSAKIKF